MQQRLMTHTRFDIAHQAFLSCPCFILNLSHNCEKKTYFHVQILCTENKGKPQWKQSVLKFKLKLFPLEF